MNFQKNEVWDNKPLFLIFKLIKYLGMLPLEFKMKENSLKCFISKRFMYITCFYIILYVLYTILTIYSALHIFYYNCEQSIFELSKI